jgi:hypothetical protein
VLHTIAITNAVIAVHRKIVAQHALLLGQFRHPETFERGFDDESDKAVLFLSG